MSGRALERRFTHTDSVISISARIQYWCVLCYFGLEKLKEESSFGHFDNWSKITNTENPILQEHLQFWPLSILGAFIDWRRNLLLVSSCIQSMLLYNY